MREVSAIMTTDAGWRIGSSSSVTVLRRRAGERISASAAGGQDARQGPRQRRERTVVVDFLRGASGQSPLGTLASALGAGAVDLFRALGRIGQHDDLVVSHFGAATRHGQVVLVAAVSEHELADS